MNHEFWYLSRAAGFTAYLLLFTSVALGIAIGTRLSDRIAKRASVFDLHRFTTIVALAFTLFHVYILLGDGYFNFNVWQLSVPFLSPYRGWQTAIGIASLYALVLIITSFYVRQFIGYRAWRALHFLTFALYAGATLHGITAGSDTTQSWARLIYLLTGGAVVALILYRVQYRMPDSEAVRTVRLVSAAATVLTALVLVFGTGLLRNAASTVRSGDAAAAQPAQQQPAQAAAQPAQAAAAGQDGHPFLASFDTDFTGTYTQSQDASGAHLTIDGLTTGDLPAKVHVELVQSLNQSSGEGERESGRATVTVNKVEVSDSATSAPLCDGQLTNLQGNYIRFTCNGVGPYQGVQMTVAAQISASDGRSFSGALSGSMTRQS